MKNCQLERNNFLLSDLLDLLFELEDFRIKYLKSLDNPKQKLQVEDYMQKVKINFAENILKTVAIKTKASCDYDILYDALMLYCEDKFTKEELLYLMTNVEDETVVEYFYQRI